MLLKLPLEVVELIVLKLSYDDIINIGCCCKVLHDIAINESLWEKCANRDFNVNLKCTKKSHCIKLEENVDRNYSSRAFYRKVLLPYGKALQRTFRLTNYDYYGGLAKLLYHNYMLHLIELDPPAYPYTQNRLQDRVICQIYLSPQSNKTLVNYLEYKPKATELNDDNPRPRYSFEVFDGLQNVRSEKTEVKISLTSTPSPLPEVMDLNNDWYHMDGDETKEKELSKRLGIPRDMARLRSRHQSLYILEGSKQYRSIEEEHSFHASYPIQPGFFKATYGSHGVEILQLYYAEPSNEIIALKITGDPNVPCGEIGFKGYLNNPIDPEMSLDEEKVDYFDNLKRTFDRAMSQDKQCHLADGNPSPQPFHLPKGYLLNQDIQLDEFKEYKWRFASKVHIAMAGFHDPRYIDAHMIIFSQDTFAVINIDIKSLKICHRVNEKLKSAVNYEDLY